MSEEEEGGRGKSWVEEEGRVRTLRWSGVDDRGGRRRPF